MTRANQVDALGRWPSVRRCLLAILIGVAAETAGGVFGSYLWGTAEAVQLCNGLA